MENCPDNCADRAPQDLLNEAHLHLVPEPFRRRIEMSKENGHRCINCGLVYLIRFFDRIERLGFLNGMKIGWVSYYEPLD